MLVNIENLKITKTKKEKNIETFSFEPLPQGFGTTLGNSLRRVLMTSVKGAAITQMKLSGANHQFTTINGVQEDVVQISLNVKKIRCKLHSDKPVIVTIEKKGKGKVTAGDIITSSDVEIMNKDLHIATISDDKASFKAEFTVEPGVGYSPMEERDKKNVKLGVIVLDALFSPIVNATFEVEPTRFEDRIDLDKTTLTIETDGSITPENSLKEAAELLKDYYAVIAKGETSKKVEDKNTEEVSTVKSHVTDNVAIEELPLQTRTVNALKKHGIDTLKDLNDKTDEELADIKNLGEKSLMEIKKLLEKENLR
ncbi:DNA-directed RNA polymerase subunit alpha [candidate division WWE3 bacterium RBG_13_37_7]|uniref:DNA-directed RNA polymerase subunit alpha n=1 Tax=candidate division WWE3 bacterium RBG_13_37_7 TaxID=1802609 RepID=A0A1F4U111_UNCKA|nr:MAG: DNA-directed RNA polymerase subunit alpha [candidate division WWE3 bacterium RBG_13_37_7]